MALARVQYQQSVSGNRNFTVPMEYISRDHIKVTVDGVNTTFTWLNNNTIQLTTAPAIGAIVDVLRETERETLLVDFQDASTITEKELDLSARQAFYIAQEAFDLTNSTMAVANDGSYSASNRRISVLGYPNSADDAANVQYVQDVLTSGKNAFDERVLAEAARDKAQKWAENADNTAVETGKYSAKHHANKAAASASSASTSASNAASYRDTANNHRLEAADSAAQASTSATNAANSASAAATSEANAANSATEAAGYAAGVKLPSALGNGGKMIRQKADESGFEYFASPGTGGGLEADLLDGRHGSEFIQLDIEKSANITSANWVTIATCSSGRAYGEFYIYDSTSSRHNSVKIIAQTSFGQNRVSVLAGVNFSTRTIAHVRILYNTADRTYGGARLQVYCENPSFTLYVRSALVSQLSGWQGWTPVTPVIEGTPSGWAEDWSSRWDNITSGVSNYGVVQVKSVMSSNTRYAITNVADAADIPELSISFAPKYSDSLILLQAMISTTATYVSSFGFARNGSALASSSTANNNVTNGLVTCYDGSNSHSSLKLINLMQAVSAGHTAALTYTVQAASSWNGSTGTLYINDRAEGDMRSRSTFTIMEIRQ